MDPMSKNRAGTKAMPVARVKNRSAADIQITAEQLLLEARERLEVTESKPRKMITDPEELREYRTQRRKEFEDRIRMQRQRIATWVQYAKWEESQGDLERARSVFERALDVDPRDSRIWMRYVEMEMKNKHIQRARNLFDRVTHILPRLDQFWYKYTYLEEMVGNLNNARVVFERWMQWEPSDQAWLSYANLELRAGEIDRARAIYERYVACHPSQSAYVRFAKWEERQGQLALARRIYERAVDELADDEKDETLYLAFAHFEQRCREFERARAIFRFALDSLPREVCKNLYREFVTFEKQHGTREGIESVVISKRREQYEAAIKENPLDYDTWFDYLRLEEAEGDVERAREVYERAVAQVPRVVEKRFWRRYIYLWINYAIFEELEARDVERARDVYRVCLRLIPHQKFTFGKIWIMAAHFEVRQKNLAQARKILGQAIGKCPKNKVFRAYIELELQLGEIDRCRTLYGKFLEFAPHDCVTWCKFADLERGVGEDERARHIYEAAIEQREQPLDMPELLWKAYIDFEIELGETGNARALYERLLDRTQHVKVWLSYAQFEADVAQDTERARAVYDRAYKLFKQTDDKEERAVIVERWIEFEERAAAESGQATTPQLRAVLEKRPRRETRSRPLYDETDTLIGYDEYEDFIFPDDKPSIAKEELLRKARLWKMRKAGQAAGGGEGEGEEATEDAGAGGGGVKRSAAEAFGEEEVE